MKYMAFLPLALLGACSQQEPAQPVDETTPQSSVTPRLEPPVRAADSAAGQTLRLEGLGAIAIGKPLPEGSSWKIDGVQASDTCLIASSPEFPGAYAIVEDGVVRRITIGARSDVKFTGGLGVGADEDDVRKSFPSLTERPHAYVSSPAKYLFDGGEDPRLMFEIGEDRKVSEVHVGTMPVLAYVEGCA